MDIRTGVGRRRRWTAEQKGMIVAASFAPGANVSDVARRHEISAQHLFQWRNAAKAGRLVLPAGDEAMFAPIVLENCASADAARDNLGLVVEIAGAVVRVNRGTDMELLTAVARALKAAA
jgi:transposase